MRKALAVVHDFARIRGGGERLVAELARGLSADLVLGDINPGLFSAEYFGDISTRDLQLRASAFGSETLGLMRAFGRRTKFLSDYSDVIYSGDIAPFAVVNHTSGRNIFYCHTPPRLAYDKRSFFLERAGPVQRLRLNLLSAYLRHAYPKIISRMDLIIANSNNVRDRIRRYWGRDAVVVYPPIDTARFRWRGDGDYYVSTARLEPLKRVEVLIDAFLRMPDRRLIVASGGSDADRLRRRAADSQNIHFTGWISDEAMAELLGNAIATLYVPEDEDFGMSPVESMAAGKPVIGVAEGGLCETVTDGETGILLQGPLSVNAIDQAIQQMTPEKSKRMRNACEARACEFSREKFLSAMHELIGTP